MQSHIEILFYSLVYVDEIYQAMLNAGDEKLEEATQELVKMAPPPMERMLVKQSREMVVVNVPPTAGTCFMSPPCNC